MLILIQTIIIITTTIIQTIVLIHQTLQTIYNIQEDQDIKNSKVSKIL